MCAKCIQKVCKKPRFSLYVYLYPHTHRKGGGTDTVYFSDECAAYLQEYFDAQRARYLISDAQIPAFTTLKGERLGVRAVENLVKIYLYSKQNNCKQDTNWTQVHWLREEKSYSLTLILHPLFGWLGFTVTLCWLILTHCLPPYCHTIISKT